MSLAKYLVLHLTLQSGSNVFRLQADTEKPEKRAGVLNLSHYEET